VITQIADITVILALLVGYHKSCCERKRSYQYVDTAGVHVSGIAVVTYHVLGFIAEIIMYTHTSFEIHGYCYRFIDACKSLVVSLALDYYLYALTTHLKTWNGNVGLIRKLHNDKGLYPK